MATTMPKASSALKSPVAPCSAMALSISRSTSSLATIMASVMKPYSSAVRPERISVIQPAAVTVPGRSSLPSGRPYMSRPSPSGPAGGCWP